MERIVSISLGSPHRNKVVRVTVAGREFEIERLGVDGNYDNFARVLRELDEDKTVKVIGLGGINLSLFSGSRQYPIREGMKLSSLVKNKPVCDGGTLKKVWEPYVVTRLVELGDLEIKGKRALVVCVADRWPLARAMRAEGATLLIGDLLFALEIPLPMHSLTEALLVTRCLLPIVTRYVPFETLYPTIRQKRCPKRYYWQYDLEYRLEALVDATASKWYREAAFLVGDWKFIRKYLLRGDMQFSFQQLFGRQGGPLFEKTIITNTTTEEDIELLRRKSCEAIVTTTPELHGRTFGTNVMEALVSTVTGLRPGQITLDHCQQVFKQLGWDGPRIKYL